MHTTVLITMVIPVVGSLPAEIRMAQSLGLYDQIWGMWILKANFLGMYFLVFYNIFKALPASYTEAAKIDGAREYVGASAHCASVGAEYLFYGVSYLFHSILERLPDAAHLSAVLSDDRARDVYRVGHADAGNELCPDAALQRRS